MSVRSYYVSILSSGIGGTLYIGVTNDPIRRRNGVLAARPTWLRMQRWLMGTVLTGLALRMA